MKRKNSRSSACFWLRTIGLVYLQVLARRSQRPEHAFATSEGKPASAGVDAPWNARSLDLTAEAKHGGVLHRTVVMYASAVADVCVAVFLTLAAVIRVVGVATARKNGAVDGGEQAVSAAC